MDPKLLKTGACSIVIGHKHYAGYIDYKPNKLIKVTKIVKGHNEFKNLSLIRKINNYSDYYCIPDEEQFILNTNDNFYQYLKILVEKEDMRIFNDNLIYNYIDYGGNKELLDSIIDIKDLHDYRFWDSYKTILDFAQKIMLGLNFLHQNKICHLDIKPENIIVDTSKKTFKIIDFGFSSVEPFDDFVEYFRGTPGYFPKTVYNEIPSTFLPEIKANDFKIIPIPYIKNRKLIYGIDSFCLGRVLYFLKIIYQENLTYSCFNFESRNKSKLGNLINDLIHPNVFKRPTVAVCLKKYFE
jgi:serine/threonine protein kinase